MQTIIASDVKIRYNTESDGKHLVWRLLIGNEEHLMNHLTINCPCETTTDWLEDKQLTKHHITVRNCILHIEPITLHVTIEQQ
ncbi:MAG: hypothetical protein EOP51_10020 [Sphingobacteriales bacterium]|nr:MAG: hypothetical protein EOP51_10020 [Sphingobacteriales bacterium]